MYRWLPPKIFLKMRAAVPLRCGFESMQTCKSIPGITVCLLAFDVAAAEPRFPDKDERAAVVKTLSTPRAFPEIQFRVEWEQRAQRIREQILVSCGLWPLPQKTPLDAKVF